MVLEICAIVAVLLIAIITIWLVRTLQTARRFMERAERSLVEMNTHIGAISQEATQMLRTSRELTQDIQAKAHALDSLFDSVQEAGDTVHQATGSVKRVVESALQTAVTIEKTTREQQGKIAQTAEWIGSGIKLWQMWQAHRNSKNKSDI